MYNESNLTRIKPFMKEADKSYVAGIIDGEGTITLPKQSTESDFRSPSVSISSTDIEILDFVQSRFGGYISKKTKRRDHYKQPYQWKVDYNGAIELLKNTINYLNCPEKKRRANLILNHWKDITPRNGKYSKEQKKLKLKFQKHFLHPEENPKPEGLSS